MFTGSISPFCFILWLIPVLPHCMKTLRAHAIGTVILSINSPAFTVSPISLSGTGYIQNAVGASTTWYDVGRSFSSVCGVDYHLA